MFRWGNRTSHLDRMKNSSFYNVPVGDRTHDLPHTVASNMVKVSHSLNHSAPAAVKWDEYNLFHLLIVLQWLYMYVRLCVYASFIHLYQYVHMYVCSYAWSFCKGRQHWIYHWYINQAWYQLAPLCVTTEDDLSTHPLYIAPVMMCKCSTVIVQLCFDLLFVSTGSVEKYWEIKSYPKTET